MWLSSLSNVSAMPAGACARTNHPQANSVLRRCGLDSEVRQAAASDQHAILLVQDREKADAELFIALQNGLHPFDRFLGRARPTAEEMGLIVPLGEWALRQPCREAMSWPNDVRVAVNLSPVQFNNHDLVRSVTEVLAGSGLPAWRLDLEITESVLLLHNTQNVGILHELRDLGVHISMDDFGTGYSSLSYLRSFPFDKIKIDQSFIRDLPYDSNSAAIVRAISALGSALGMAIVAEGVERPDQLARLRVEGCDSVQGHLFSVPRPASEVPGLLKRFHPSEPLEA